MAARVLFIGIACTVGLITGKTIGLELGVEEGGVGEFVGVKNHALHLPCRPTYPSVVTWTHDGQPVYNDSRRYIDKKGSLIITKVVHKKKGESDRGTYQCTVKNSYGAIISSPIKVVIAGMAHEFNENPLNTTVTEGDVLRLKCSIESSPPAKISWMKDDKPLPQNKRFIQIDSGVLYIGNVRKEDSGYYKCQALNGYIKKSRVSHIGEVVVNSDLGISHQPLKFLESAPPVNLTLRKGTKGLIICAVSGIPRPNLKWIKTEGYNVSTQTEKENVYHVQNTNNGLNVIQIDNVNQDYSGKYECIATHKIKDKPTSIRMNVNIYVEVPPIIVEPPKSQMYPAAKTVRIECEVKGYPMPNVTWYKNGKKLSINGRIKQNAKELVLGGTSSQDTGVYQCIATSSAGVAWGAGRLVVNTSSDQPNPPNNLTCTTISPSQVNLSWAQEQQSDVKAFTVHYSPADGGDELKEVAENETFIVSKLQPFTNYSFYVRSYGKAASEPSRPVICMTGEAVPTRGPKVTAVATPYCINVSWLPPPSSEARGSITEYKIQWKRSNQSSTNFEKVPGNINQYTIRDVIQEHQYFVRVIGATALGWPDLTEDKAPWVKIFVPKNSSNPYPPPIMQLTSVNETTIHVEWSYPSNISVEGFKLYFGQLNRTERTMTIHDRNATDFYISHLDPSTWYEVSVKAYSGDVEGESCVESKSTRERVLFAPSLPVPISLEATSFTPHSINISWLLPSHQNAYNITHYTVFYNLLHSPNHNFTGKTVQTYNSSIQVSGLIPNTLYEFSVRAHGFNNQVSAVSSKVECQTLQEILDVVEGVKLKVLNSSSVHVSWKGIKLASYYSIFYSQTPSAPLSLWHHENIYKNQTSIELTGLNNNQEYSLRIRGGSSAGAGPLSAHIYFTLATDEEKRSHDGSNSGSSLQPDQFLGVIIGCSISLLCIILCTASLVYKKKCAKNHREMSANGNGQCSSEQEMQALTQLVSKSSFPNGHVNGMKRPLINGGIPNGKIQDKGVRIKESPQRVEVECSSNRTTDEGDSLLSGPDPEMENDETQITNLNISSLSKELPPDDGFHETSNIAPNW